jgi:hypothetical protein
VALHGGGWAQATSAGTWLTEGEYAPSLRGLARFLGEQRQHLWTPPKSKVGAFGNAFKIIVGRQHRQVMPDAQPSEKSVNRSDLDAAAATLVSQRCSFDVIIAIRYQQGHGGKPADDLVAGLGAGEPLQELLQDEAGGYERLIVPDGLDQDCHLYRVRQVIAPECERPNACINKERQSRVRSAL